MPFIHFGGMRGKNEKDEETCSYIPFFFFHMHCIMLTISFYFRFMRSVAYRQFVRLVYAYVGASRRIPLLNCVYNSIREAFPNVDSECKGYEGEEI